MYCYNRIISTVKTCFPEIESNKVVFEPEFFKYCFYDDLPYVFFPVFWKLLELALTGKVKNNGLTDRIFEFMENMAKSDEAVRNLMAVEMLEPLFSLDGDVYMKVVTHYLKPETLNIHKKQQPYFLSPCEESW